MVHLALLLITSAHAEGYSTDIELVRPGFTGSGLPGVDSPLVRDPNAWRVGLLGQYQRDPLILYEFGNELGPIVDTRGVAQLGVSRTLGKSTDLRVVMPFVVQGDGEIPELAAGGAGLGDISVAGVLRALSAGPAHLGARAELILPTGRRNAYTGEANLRTSGAALAHVSLWRIDLLTDLGLVIRTGVATQEDFDLGSELVLSGGLRFHVLPEKVAVYVATVDHTALADPWSGGAASPAESYAGVQVRPVSPLLIDLGVGRGWTPGYGTTQERVMFGATWRIPERKPEVVPIIRVVEQPPPPPPPEPEEEVVAEPEPWGKDELAREVGEKIEIREPIQFEFDTDHILPESLPVLRAVADVLERNDRIGHLVVEGHASEEGGFEYNYDLSIRRARAIWEQLVTAGVNPNRVSYRGMGEVVPAAAGAGEGDLARNRRAEFHIVYRLGPLDIPPRHPQLQQLPWSGENTEVKQ